MLNDLELFVEELEGMTVAQLARCTSIWNLFNQELARVARAMPYETRREKASQLYKNIESWGRQRQYGEFLVGIYSLTDAALDRLIASFPRSGGGSCNM